MSLLAKHAVALLGGVTFFAAVASPLLAQDVNRTNFTLLERLVIGAGVDKIAIDTPQAVTVLDQNSIDAQQATTIGGVLRDVPGVTMAGSGRQLGEAFNIRGLGETENAADAARIIVNVDGTPKFYEQYRMGSFFADPELFKRVEVLRGPASSTLYGSGALGGVINFQTKDASDFIKDGHTAALRLKAAYDSNGQGTLTSAIYAQELNDRTDLLLAGNWRRNGVYSFANGFDAEGSNAGALSGLAKLTMHLDDTDEQILKVSYQRWQSTSGREPYMQTSTPLPIPGSFSFGYINRDVADDTVTLAYSHAGHDNKMLDANVALSYTSSRVKQYDAEFPHYGSIMADSKYEYSTWQLKADNTFDFSGEGFENYLTIGSVLSHQNRVLDVDFAGGAIGTHPEGTDTKFGVFAQNEFIWDDRLTLIGGARVDLSSVNPGATILGSKNPVEVNNLGFSPKIAALYKIDDNLNIFGSVSYTERLPTIDEIYSYSASKPNLNPDLSKERALSYEIGGALHYNDVFQSGDVVSSKATVFYNDINDFITSAPAGNTYYWNIPNVTIYGAELEASYESEMLFANAAYTATWGYNTATNTPLTSIPAHRLNLTVGTRLPEHGVELGARAKFVAEAENSIRATSANPVSQSKAYQSYDVFANWTPETGMLEGTKIQFSVENIFNSDFQDNLSTDPSRGRTFKLSLTKQFDY